jgi:hypothetical protein
MNLFQYKTLYYCGPLSNDTQADANDISDDDYKNLQNHFLNIFNERQDMVHNFHMLYDKIEQIINKQAIPPTDAEQLVQQHNGVENIKQPDADVNPMDEMPNFDEPEGDEPVVEEPVVENEPKEIVYQAPQVIEAPEEIPQIYAAVVDDVLPENSFNDKIPEDIANEIVKEEQTVVVENDNLEIINSEALKNEVAQETAAVQEIAQETKEIENENNSNDPKVLRERLGKVYRSLLNNVVIPHVEYINTEEFDAL